MVGRWLEWRPASRESAIRESLLLLSALAWLTYTKLYFVLQPRHLTVDGGILMSLFNRPDPGCGLTRTFAWMWRADLVRAFLVYPLGPLIFVAVLGLAGYAGAALLWRRRLAITLPARTWGAILAVASIALGLNWAAKLLWLGM